MGLDLLPKETQSVQINLEEGINEDQQMAGTRTLEDRGLVELVLLTPLGESIFPIRLISSQY
jgi:hypothetical protein